MRKQLIVIASSLAVSVAGALALASEPAYANIRPEWCCSNPPLETCRLTRYVCTDDGSGNTWQDCNWVC